MDMQILRDRANSSATTATSGLPGTSRIENASNGTTAPAPSPASNAGSAAGASLDAACLRLRVDAQIGRNRSLQAELRHCKGQLDAERNRCQDLENRLADKEAEIDILRKREQRVRPSPALISCCAPLATVATGATSAACLFPSATSVLLRLSFGPAFVVRLSSTGVLEIDILP